MLRLFIFFMFPICSIGQDCSNVLELIGQREIHQSVTDFYSQCGPFEEKIAADGMSKTWLSDEKGIDLTFVNRAENHVGLPKFEVMSVVLRSFTGKGGYKEELPFGFLMGMDHKMVKSHIEGLKSVDLDKKDLGKKSSSFVYTGSPNSELKNRQIKVYISQIDGKTITSMSLRLK